MGIPPAGVRNSGGGTVGGVDLRLPPPEHSSKLYCNQSHYGPVSGYGVDAGVKYDQAVAGAGLIGCGEYADSGSVGGTDRGGEETYGMETETD